MSGRPIIQREPAHRSRKLLDIAHKAPCFATFPHECTQHNGCEPAHSDAQIFGRGVGHKTPDWAVAFMCHNAHVIISAKVGGGAEREQKFMDWLRAYVATQNYLWNGGKVKLA